MLPKRAGVPLLAGLRERPRPAAIEILGDALAAAPPGDAVLTPQARQDYTDLLFCRKSPACRSATIYSGNMFVTPSLGTLDEDGQWIDERAGSRRRRWFDRWRSCVRLLELAIDGLCQINGGGWKAGWILSWPDAPAPL
jgi:hypothetical protein